MRQERKYNFAKLYLLSHTQLALFTELLKKEILYVGAQDGYD
ncbi:hypothetical protein HMPREF0793_1792 [Staphylococcus caprae M23864:W1]|nr:hypothetical protein HMPREF0793_1792 [Staphylococcus caprae M23864:W1]